MSEERVGDPIRDNRTARTFAGLLLAPVAGGLGSPLIVSLVICVIDFINRGFDWHAFEVMSSLGQFTFYFLIYAALFGIPISLAIGTLAYLALRRRGLNGFVVYLVGGATIGMVGAMSVSALAGLGVGLLLFPVFIALMSCSGGIGGLVFWLIRRPDRDAPSASPTP